MHLIVRVPFHGHEIGDRITDPERVKSILGGAEKHLESHCIKIPDNAHGWTPPAPKAAEDAEDAA